MTPTSTNGQIEFMRDRLVREKLQIETLVNAAVDHAAKIIDRGVSAAWFAQMCDIVDEIADMATKRIDDEYDALCDVRCGDF
jgi:hypothetical protein